MSSKHDEHTEGKDEDVARKALDRIGDCQMVLEDLNGQASNEILQVETKYVKLRKPYYDQRASLIEKIPNFWATAIANHPHIALLVDEEEEDCLSYLEKVEVEEFENFENGFRIKFIFGKNPYFDNLELVKEFSFQTTDDTESKSTSTTIKWNEGMDISKKLSQIIEQRKKKGLEQETFFSWFCDDDKDPVENLVAEMIKDDLWTNPLQYYLEDDDSDGDEESSEEEDDSDGDGEESDEENAAEGNAKVGNGVGEGGEAEVED